MIQELLIDSQNRGYQVHRSLFLIYKMLNLKFKKASQAIV